MNKITNLINNAWNWDLIAFSKYCNLDPDDKDTREAFSHFQTAANNLRQLDQKIIDIITNSYE